MSLPKEPQEELFSAGNELPGYLPENDPMVVFGREIYPVFTDGDFQGYYSTKGRNAISPAFLARVTLLQFREHLSDPETAEAVVRRLDWKIALRLQLRENVSFDPSTLCVYRKRLRESQAMTLIFDKIVALAQEKGFIHRRTRQRVDATHIIAHVNRISTTDLLFRTVKCLVEEIEQKDPEYYEKELPEHIRERYSNRFSSFGISKDKRAEKLAEIVEDGLCLKRLLGEAHSEHLSDLRQLPIMETIFAENVTITTKEVEQKVFVEVQEVQTPHQTIFDPRDTGLKLGIKGKTHWVGSKCHIVETAERGKVNFITNMIYQRANEDDSQMHERIRAGNERRGFLPETVYTDMKYISGTAIQDYRDRGMELMGYIQGDTSKKPLAFQVQKFNVDMQALTAVCPAGQQSLPGRVITADRVLIPFSATTCRGCTYCPECVGTKSEKRRVLRVSVHHERICERRQVQQTESFRQEMRVRAQVEGTISEGVRFFGLRRAKYKGEAGHQMQFYLTGAAMNVKRLIKAVTQGREIRTRTVRVCTV